MAMWSVLDGLRAIWRSRATGWLLLVSLYLGALTIPSERSVAGGMSRMVFCAGMRHGCRRYEPVLVWRDAAGSLQSGMWYDDGVREQVDSLPDALQCDVAYGVYLGPRREDGAFWAPLWKTKSYRIMGIDTQAGLTPSESAIYRAAMFDELTVSGRYAPLPPALRVSDVRISVFSWLGLASNAWGLLCASGLVAWWHPVRRARRARAARAEADRRRRGECLQCGYSREGLAADRCPECGGELEAVVSGSIDSSAIPRPPPLA